MGITSINPATGEIIKTFAPTTDAGVEDKLKQAQKTFEQYRNIPVIKKTKWLNEVALILERNRSRFGRIITL